MKIEILKQFSVFLPNKPGSLSALTRKVAEEGINILGIASEVRDDSGVVRLAVSGAQDVSEVLSRNGITSIESKLLSVEFTDKPGTLATLAKTLADGGVNITTVYGTTQGSASRILFAVENTDKALKILERANAAVS